MRLERKTRMTGVLTLTENGHWIEVQRVDAYPKPARWFWSASEEVEIWALPDGRRIRAGRRGPEDWRLTWRAA